PTPPRPTLVPSTTLFRSRAGAAAPAVIDDLDPVPAHGDRAALRPGMPDDVGDPFPDHPTEQLGQARLDRVDRTRQVRGHRRRGQDRKSTRLNSSHVASSY